MKKNKFLSLLLTVIILLGTIGYSASNSKTENSKIVEKSGKIESKELENKEKVKLRIGVLAAMTALPIVDIANNNLDEEVGLDIELIYFTTGAPMNEAMAAGEIDASCIGAAAVFALANYDAKMICEICDDTVAIELFSRPNSEIVKVKGDNKDYSEIIGSADSVKGSTVLCPAGTLSQYEVSKYLDVFGLTNDDIQFVPMEYAQAYQAFKTGEGDIIALRSPQTYTAVDEEGWVSVATLSNLKSSATAQIVVSNNTYEEKFDALVTLVKLVHETNDKLNNDVEYAAKVMTDWFVSNGQEIDIEIAEKQLSTKPFYGTEDAKTREFGADFKNTFVGFMISTEQVDESDRDKINSNVKSDVVKVAYK